MKRLLSVTIAVFLALSMLLPFASATMAQTPSPTPPAPVVKALAIRAPDAAIVGQVVPIRVVLKGTDRPVPKAAVWAIDAKNITTEPATPEAWATLIKNSGQLLGITDLRGMVSHRFKSPARYVLIALKEGFTPAFHRLAIRPLNSLIIRAPNYSWVGRTIPIRVMDPSIKRPVLGASVYAVSLKLIAAGTVQSPESFADLAKSKGFLIGTTNQYGEVRYAFKEAGGYLLVAIKEGYLPGFVRIGIMPAQPRPTTTTLHW